ncbi:MAG: hypothetical protein M3Y42_18455 [Actinomycetota bacterium]|nr:hypothetical protein [Actinomycetota bacterium]MDQ2958926.1 hypothetical protein [Actinomycetota bacterium]
MDELQPLAALVSRQAADLEVYAGFLFAALDGALPPELLVVERRASMLGRLRGQAGETVAVSVRLGDRRFSLRRTRPGAPTQSSISHEVGGIVLSTNQVPLADWSAQLASALHQLAQRNAGAATALQRLTSFTV